jgi:type VI secretion system secreted protein VgrG
MSFAPDSLLSNGSGGSPSGSMSALGGLAGSMTSGVANQLGPLAGLAGHVDTVQRAAQLAQTGFSLMNKPPSAVADTMNC